MVGYIAFKKWELKKHDNPPHTWTTYISSWTRETVFYSTHPKYVRKGKNETEIISLVTTGKKSSFLLKLYIIIRLTFPRIKCCKIKDYKLKYMFP